MILCFRGKAFNGGRIEIVNEHEEPVGVIGLLGLFRSSMAVFGRDGDGPLFGGKFRMLSHKWAVTDASGEECGMLKCQWLSLFERYEYDRYGVGGFKIKASLFSRKYEIRNDKGELVVSFQKVNRWLESPAFRLTVHRRWIIDGYEWVVVVMGINEIQKRMDRTG